MATPPGEHRYLCTCGGVPTIFKAPDYACDMDRYLLACRDCFTPFGGWRITTLRARKFDEWNALGLKWKNSVLLRYLWLKFEAVVNRAAAAGLITINNGGEACS